MAHSDPVTPAVAAASVVGTAQAGTAAAAAPGADAVVVVEGYRVAVDRRYDPETHMWVKPVGGARAVVGMDPLGVETSGTLAQVSLLPPGAELAGGRPFGQLEAAKFVGPLISPVSGRVLAANEDVMAGPGIVERDPFGAGWLVEIEMTDAEAELPALPGDPDEITRWFAAQVEAYRVKGVLAE